LVTYTTDDLLAGLIRFVTERICESDFAGVGFAEVKERLTDLDHANTSVRLEKLDKSLGGPLRGFRPAHGWLSSVSLASVQVVLRTSTQPHRRPLSGAARTRA
jgi:hypothetical protein